MVATQAAFLTQRSVLIMNNNGLCDELDYANDCAALPDVFERGGERWQLSSWFEAKLNAAIPLPGVSLIVHPRWHPNYTHWHVEALSALLDPLLPLEAFDNVCVPTPTPMRAESLSNIDLRHKQLVPLDQPAHRFEVAVLPSHSLFRTFPHPSLGPRLAEYGATMRRRYGY